MNKIILALDTTNLAEAINIAKKVKDKIFTIKLGLEFFNAHGKNGKRCSCIMSEKFNLEIVSPEKSFLKKDNISEVVVPAFEGEMGILKDHISIISFLKPGIIKIFSGNEEEKFYVDDGIIEFKNNTLSILTSDIFDIKNSDKVKIQEMIKQAESDLIEENLDDQRKFIISQKVEVLKSLSLN